MNNLTLIDTSVWIFALRKKYDSKIKSYVEELIDEDKAVINSIIKIELTTGTRTKKEFSRLKSRLDALPEVFINQDIWEETQKNAFELRRKGVVIPLVDTIILSCAKHKNMILAHRDRHFDLARKIVKIKTKSFI